ncbi:cyclopropane-fatty-acyl-phospholipid synthase family protein [Ponticaulis sp.]|uniref:SAM-dependent methyltransferase n=1 Tax=Ponticaulis sp. TaxID=2020902 RepID=UPI000B736799|nr:cyclopropane-fatty-acyl-phospholipid synthase family protein [Ponticaulis sp.]MAI89373.1 SAM-dependent methyltransferase [Ponticaulis sp.]OUY00414.1 MAG: SAM-dependent methyltransferase [Hyphomonadaceae bacterium TMED5]|tara:strand:- start:9377 stop:10606 length:1230 start_codon:yes stop_codon:yes gene_type:complete
MTTTYDVVSETDLNRISRLPSSVKLAFLALRSTKKGRLLVSLPDGRYFLFDHGNPGPRAEIHVKDLALFNRVLAAGDIGFADAYMDEQFETPDLTNVLEFFAVNFDQAGRLSRGSTMKNALRWIANALLRQNTKKGSKQNILAHYDLGNDFYEKWLDPSMTYSSGLFENGETLAESQTKKYSAIADKVGANATSNLLEIGCGWGGFAEYVARERGSHIHCVTISDAQHEFARKRIFEAGLNDKVQIELCDYRDIEGSFDGVVSIEMFEAVGEAYWPGYFSKIHHVLSPGARAALQIITIDDQLFASYRKRVDFIQKYIFPGGMLISIDALKEEISKSGMSYESEHMFGQSYADTLSLWNDAFKAAWPEIEAMGFDTKFRNLWEYYLSYCEAGFSTGRTDVGQFVMSRPS